MDMECDLSLVIQVSRLAGPAPSTCPGWGRAACLPFYHPRPLPRYAIPPYLITKGLREGVWQSIFDSKGLNRKRIDLLELATAEIRPPGPDFGERGPYVDSLYPLCAKVGN